MYLTRSNEIVGYNLRFDLTRARRNALGDPLSGLSAKLIHVYPLEHGSGPAEDIRSYLKT